MIQKFFIEHLNDMDDNYRKFLKNEYQRMNIKDWRMQHK